MPFELFHTKLCGYYGAMPTVFRHGPYRCFFYSSDGDEPPHVHVEHERKTCKFWLEPLRLARNHGFGAHELNVIRRIIHSHRAIILEAWHEHCG